MRVFSRFAATGVVVAALVAAGTVSAVAGGGGPAPAEADRAPAGLRAGAAGSAYLVQFKAAPLDSQRQQLRRLGARIGAYLPDFAYVVRMNPATRAKVGALAFIRWIGAYHPGDK